MARNATCRRLSSLPTKTRHEVAVLCERNLARFQCMKAGSTADASRD